MFLLLKLQSILFQLVLSFYDFLLQLPVLSHQVLVLLQFFAKLSITFLKFFLLLFQFNFYCLHFVVYFDFPYLQNQPLQLEFSFFLLNVSQ